MKRDMDLCRKILLKIEEEFVDVSLYLEIEGYSAEEIAYHCRIMHEAGLLASFKAQYANNHLYDFAVGPLTWEGHEFLDRIRDDSIWGKTKNTIIKKGLPMIFEVIKSIAQAFISAATEGVVTAVVKGQTK